jgi:4-oxalocrotonate tautomerase
MPLVRFSHATGQLASFGPALFAGVHRALMDAFNVPSDDYFQIVTEHAPGTGVVGPSAFLGIVHTADIIVVQITCAEGRSVEQKRELFARIALHLADNPGVRPEDVIVSLVETKRENGSFGNDIAQFAP